MIIKVGGGLEPLGPIGVYAYVRPRPVPPSGEHDESLELQSQLLSLTYHVLTTITQPSYLHNLITVQPPRSTRSSSLVTLARPSILQRLL